MLAPRLAAALGAGSSLKFAGVTVIAKPRYRADAFVVNGTIGLLRPTGYGLTVRTQVQAYGFINAGKRELGLQVEVRIELVEGVRLEISEF